MAGRIKDRWHRPTAVFAEVGKGEIKGSVRSIAGVHIRDVLANIAAEYPSMLQKFGGQCLAGGLSLRKEDFEPFSECFEKEVQRWLQPENLEGVVWTDGTAPLKECDWRFVEMLKHAAPWGQAFPAPLFDDVFEIVEQHVVGGRHLKLSLCLRGSQEIFPSGVV